MRRSLRFLPALAALVLASAAFAQAPVITDLGLLPGDSEVLTATNSQQDHAIARGGDQYLVVWSDYRGQSSGSSAAQGSADVFGIRLDAAGQPIDAMPFLVAGGMGEQKRPLVAWNGSAWLVVYLSQDPVGGYYDHVMRAVRVSPAGQVLDATPIRFPPTTFTPNTVGLQLAGQNGQWLVTRCIYHEDGYGTYLAGQRIDANGTLLDAAPVMLMDWVYGATVSLAANGEYLVAGPDWNGVSPKARRVGSNGQPVGAEFTLPSLQLATNGTEFYVVWVRDYVNLVGSRMSATGVLATPAGTMLVANFAQYSQSTLAHDGTQWWFEWGVSDQLHTLRINAAGAVLDPNGGRLLPVSIGGNVNTAYAVQMAGRAGGGVLVTWYDLRVALGYDTNVWTLPVSGANVAGVERSASTGTRNQRAPDFSAGPGTTRALVYVSEAANDDRVMLQRLDADGAPVAAPMLVASAPAIGRASVAWNGSMFLVAWDGGVTGDPTMPIEARRLNGDGTFVDAAPFDVMSGFEPDVEALGDDFLVACARAMNYQTITAFMRIVDGPTRAFVTPATVLGGGYVSVGPRVKQDGTRWVVTYHTHWSHDATQSDAVYQFVTPAGAVTAGLNPSTYSGGAGTPDVAFGGGRYLFVWRSNSLANANNYVSGRIMNPDGSFATPNFVISEAAGRQLRPVVEWDGSHFLVMWEDQRAQASFYDERTDIYGARVSPAGALLDANGFAVHASPNGDAGPALIAGPDGHALVASARFLPGPGFDTYRIGLTYVGGPDALDAPLAGPAVSLTSAPNPLRTGTTLAWVLPREERVHVAVHDLQGRVVRTLVPGVTQPAGRHAAAWDGRDAGGARVAPGVYLVALRTPSEIRTRRVVVTP